MWFQRNEKNYMTNLSHIFTIGYFISVWNTKMALKIRLLLVGFRTMNKSTKSCQSEQNWHQKRKLRFGSIHPPPSWSCLLRQVFIKSAAARNSIENLKNLTCCHNAAQITNVDLKPREQSDFYLCQDLLSRPNYGLGKQSCSKRKIIGGLEWWIFACDYLSLVAKLPHH